jgi:hypothetical protein
LTKPSTSPKQIVLGLSVLGLLTAIGAVALYGLSKVVTGTFGGAVAGGIVGLFVTVVSKSFEFQKNRDAAIAEKRRDVYRRLLEPWGRLFVDGKSGKTGHDMLANIDLAAMYNSCFDAVLYGSDAVVQSYVTFRTPDQKRDGLDVMRDLAKLLVAMREDVTGRKSTLSEEAVLGTFVNFSEEERQLLRVRQYVERFPEAQKRLAEVLAGKGGTPSTKT